MKNVSPTAEVGLEEQCFDRRIARWMSLWCLSWLAMYVIGYVQLTWRLISDLQGLPWIMVISPCFWAWVATFALATLVTERLIVVSWHRFEKKLNLTKVAITIVLIPFALGMLMINICPYIYPAVSGTLRLVPIIGGRGF